MEGKPEKEKLFQSLIDGYSNAFPNKSKKQVQLDVSNIWKQMKKTDDLVKSVSAQLAEWKSKEMQLKGNLLSFWSKVRYLLYIAINY